MENRKVCRAAKVNGVDIVMRLHLKMTEEHHRELEAPRDMNSLKIIAGKRE